jgi:hypothetical protein
MLAIVDMVVYGRYSFSMILFIYYCDKTSRGKPTPNPILRIRVRFSTKIQPDPLQNCALPNTVTNNAKLQYIKGLNNVENWNVIEKL